MSVEEHNIVDVISTDIKTGHVVLTVSDHLDWSDTVQHQAILQTKLNKYLAFVESGELLESYAEAKGRPVAFNVVFKFKPDAKGCEFLSKAEKIVESAGFTLRYEVFA